MVSSEIWKWIWKVVCKSPMDHSCWHTPILNPLVSPSEVEYFLNTCASCAAMNPWLSICSGSDNPHMFYFCMTVLPRSKCQDQSQIATHHTLRSESFPLFTSGFESQGCRWDFYQNPWQVLWGLSAETNHKFPYVTNYTSLFPKPKLVSTVDLITSSNIQGFWSVQRFNLPDH